MNQLTDGLSNQTVKQSRLYYSHRRLVLVLSINGNKLWTGTGYMRYITYKASALNSSVRLSKENKTNVVLVAAGSKEAELRYSDVSERFRRGTTAHRRQRVMIVLYALSIEEKS